MASGELSQACEGCGLWRLLKDQLDGAEQEIRAWRVRYRELARNVEQEAKDHEAYAEVKELFDLWRKRCGHPRARFNAGRFNLALPFWQKDGPALCRRAIEGAAFDPFTQRRKNGTIKRFDDWELIFRNRGKFEEFANRAPINGKPSGEELHQLTISLLAEMPEDERPTEDRIHEAVAQAQQIYRERSRE